MTSKRPWRSRHSQWVEELFLPIQLPRPKARIPIADVEAIPLGDARTKDTARAIAAKYMGQVAGGNDPAAERKREAAEAKRKADADKLTFGVLPQQWKEKGDDDKDKPRRESYVNEALRALRFAFSKQLDEPAAELDREAVKRTIQSLTKDGRKAMVSRTGAYGRALYAWALKHDLVAVNPFANLPLPKVKARDRVLSDDEIRAIWHARLVIFC